MIASTANFPMVRSTGSAVAFVRRWGGAPRSESKIVDCRGSWGGASGTTTAGQCKTTPAGGFGFAGEKKDRPW